MAKSFKFFASYLDAACELNSKDRGDFLFAIAQYGINGEEVPLKKSLRPLWIAIKPNIDNSRKYQSSGEKGGRPKKPPFENPESPLSENEKPDKDKDMDKEEDTNKDKNTEEEKDKQQPTAPPAAVAPHKGALGGSTVLDSSKTTERDSETEAARQRFLNSIKRPAWPAADAATPDVMKEDEE